MMTEKTFSYRLERWLRQDTPKTVGELFEVFGEKSFAVTFMLLLIFPALPLPTGGVTHVFEIIAMLLALEMILGNKNPWIPRRWQKTNLRALANSPKLHKIIRAIRWVERRSRPRLRVVLRRRLFLRLTGLIVLIFCAAAFVAPPFSGLDTLPALGVVLIGLSLILEDMAVYVIGLVAGSVGIGLVIALGGALLKSFTWL